LIPDQRQYKKKERELLSNRIEKLLDVLRVTPGRQINLRKDYDPGYIDHFMSKEDAAGSLEEGILQLSRQQDILYAQNTYALLINLQAMDAAGKDSTIKHVMSGVNPQGVQVTSFKEPNTEELDHDYLWRNFKALPNRGGIGIFNRSYYEEVLIVRVHPEFLDRQQLPPDLKDNNIWNRRYEEINNFEKYLTSNGIVVLKFFLNVSRDVQKKRFRERVDQPDKNWKFSASDLLERRHWDAYMDAYEEMFKKTSTPHAPWYIIPADHKWFTRFAVVSIINHTLDNLHLAYPAVSREQQEALLSAKAEMEKEDEDARDQLRKKKTKKKIRPA
jgi:PPK2 family polyphosphate:nucleotide phosphotransferase